MSLERRYVRRRGAKWALGSIEMGPQQMDAPGIVGLVERRLQVVISTF
jgi:hypothetical protein